MYKRLTSLYILLLLVLGLINVASPTGPTTYWIATTGDDTVSCANSSGASDPGVGHYKKTPRSVFANNCLVSGDILMMKAGTYTGTDLAINENQVTVPNGTANQHTIITGAGPGVTILRPDSSAGCNNGNLIYDAQYIDVTNFTYDMLNTTTCTSLNAFYFSKSASNSHDVLMQDMEVLNAENSAVFSGDNSSNITLRRVHFHANGTDAPPKAPGHGFYLQGNNHLVEFSEFDHNGCGTCNSGGGQFWHTAAGVDTGIIFRYNYVHDNASFGLASRTSGALIYRNLLINNGSGDGIDVGYDSGASGNLIYHNVIYKNTGASNYAITIGLFGVSTGTLITNNYILGYNSGGNGGEHGQINIYNSNSTGTVLTTNRSTGVITDCFVSTTVFTQTNGSVCINAGTAITGYGFNGSAPDIGTFEKFTFATCVVENATPSLLSVTFNNSVSPPMSPATGITGFTARKAGANDVITAAVRTGTNRADLTLTNAIINGNAVDVSYSAGNLTDTALIGNTLSQPYVETLTNQSCTNNVGAPSTYTFSQDKFEYHNLRGTEAAPQLMPWTCPTCAANGTLENYANAAGFMPIRPGGSIRIRVSILNATADPPPTGFLFYYSRNAGAYTLLPSTFGTDNVAYCGGGPDPDIPSDFTPTTNQLSTSGTFAPGALLRTANGVPSVDMVLNGKTEMEACVTFNSTVSAGDTYAFRARRDDGTVLDTYTVTPTLQIQAASASGGF